MHLGMLLRSDLVRAFRAARFTSEDEVEALLRQVGQVTAAEVAKLIPVVLELAPKSPRATHDLRSEAFAALALAAGGTDLFVPCVRALKQADAIFGNTLAALLPQINDVRGHGELCELLRSTEPGVRALAGDVLKQVGGRSALEALTKLAEDAAFPGRMEAMSALVGKAGQHAVPLLAAVVRRGRPVEKLHALRYLGDKERFRDTGPALAAIGPALQDRDDLVVAQAITSAGQLEAPAFFDLVGDAVETRGAEVLRAFLVQAARRPSDAAFALLRDRFRDGPKNVRLMVLEAVEGSGAEAYLPLLVEALSHRDVAIRTRAAHALTTLSKSGKIDAARAIVWLLKSRDVNVRRLAAEVANSVGDRDGTLAPRLLQSLRDHDWWVRERVLDALVDMNAAAVTRHLVKDYLTDPSSVVRRFGVSALIRVADVRALGALVRTAQEDVDWLVAELAVEAIGKLGDARAVAYVTNLLGARPELTLACLEALRALKAVDALPEVAELVQHDDADVRVAALGLLFELDDGTHALWAKACESDPSPAVREAAARLLERFDLGRAEHVDGDDASSLDRILAYVVQQRADDVFLFPDQRPYMKQSGRMRPFGSGTLGEEALRALLLPHLTAHQREDLARGVEVDFSYEVGGRGARFRVNVFNQLRGLSAVFRAVKGETPTLGELGIPAVVATFSDLPNGLVLVGGPTGAGKSTTLAALIDHINRRQARHIVTVEDPIEVVHRRAKSLINQRELGPHTRSLGAALRSALREDPDVILVGELRDIETISFAVSAAETGHLVLGTVHTTSADATVDRLINAFPPRQQAQVRSMLAESLRAVTCQYLLRNAEGRRVPAVEVMIANEAIQSLIRKGKAFQIPTMIATGRDQGMQSMDYDLIRLAKAGQVVLEEAYAKAVDKRAFEAALGLPSPDDEPATSQPPVSKAQPSGLARSPSLRPRREG